MVQPGDSVLIKTGIALELPRGSYGRVAPRSSLAIRGIETGAGVIDRDFRGEVKVLLRNHSDVDLRIYKGDRVAQLVIEKILELEVNCVEELTTTARGSRGFGYSAHEELYPWAEPDDPSYQHQEMGTRNPVNRISVRAMRVDSRPEESRRTSTGQPSESQEMDVPEEPPAVRPEPAGRRQVPDPDVWHRGEYNYEAERNRRAQLGLRPTAWDRMMQRRGPRRNFGGTWVRVDSEGNHIVYSEPGMERRVQAASSSQPQGDGEGGGDGQGAADRQPELMESTPGIGPSIDGPLRLVTHVGYGITMGRWEVKNEEVLDFLRDMNFQPGFLTEKLRRRVGIPPRRTSAKDDWLLLEDHQHGKKITVREHMQDRKKMYDFETTRLWDLDEWSPWRMTIAWQVVGSTLGKTKLIVVDQRSGRKGCYLPFSWVGYTLFKTG